MKTLHIITELDVGGAETFLTRLLTASEIVSDEVEVIALSGPGERSAVLQDAGIPVHHLAIPSGMARPSHILTLRRLIERSKPDLLQTWLYHADLLGSLAAIGFRAMPVLWNLRTANLSDLPVKRSTRAIIWANARLSKWLPDRIVCCSENALIDHVAHGFCAHKMTVINNGFDVPDRVPDMETRSRAKAGLSIPAGVPVVGSIGRWAPAKNYRGLVEALATMATEVPNFRALFIGKDLDNENVEFKRWLENAGIAEKCELLGLRNDIASLLPAFDVLASASVAEGFPNVVGEAMSVGVPCVVTDVGNSRELVGEAGTVVDADDMQGLGRGIAQFLRLPYEDRGRIGYLAWSRIRDNFALDSCVRKYRKLYEEVVEGV
jgi:glycosyltransferase involved in cell wall biosynthesis